MTSHLENVDGDRPDGSAEEPSFWDRLDGDASPEPADWSGDDLEQAYLRAMEALEASEAELPELPVEAPQPELSAGSPAAQPSVADLVTSGAEPTADRIEEHELAAELGALSKQAAQRHLASEMAPAPIAPRQVLEALLFVGGKPLTTKKLGGVLRGEFSAEFIESQLDELNDLYATEGRPYEIRLGDGGYRIHLREDFERIRRKAYGLGPKEVRLSQDALEVLAVVAYHQPVTAQTIEELGKPGCGPALRQLIRRELISVERSAEPGREVAYRTTPRFLSLFGIRNLNELPRPEQVGYK
jgi:segregation and condensation protein B